MYDDIIHENIFVMILNANIILFYSPEGLLRPCDPIFVFLWIPL
jgi:hypothetical protein